MSTAEKQALVRGTFEPREAEEILTNLFRSKLQFHSTTHFAIKERTGRNSLYHKNRIKELNISLQKVREFVEECEVQQARIKIDCLISLKSVK